MKSRRPSKKTRVADYLCSVGFGVCEADFVIVRGPKILLDVLEAWHIWVLRLSDRQEVLVSSMDTMTECVRRGMTIEKTGTSSDCPIYGDYLVSAKEERR